jgi:hypothetical protein
VEDSERHKLEVLPRIAKSGGSHDAYDTPSNHIDFAIGTTLQGIRNGLLCTGRSKCWPNDTPGSGDPGREIEGPMALVILGGLVTSTALNLLVLPTLALRYGRFEQVTSEQ